MTDVAIILNGDGLVTLPRSVLRNLVERAQRAEAERDALRAAADGLAEALIGKTVIDPDNSNGSWQDAQARVALAAYRGWR